MLARFFLFFGYIAQSLFTLSSGIFKQVSFIACQCSCNGDRGF